MFEAEITLSLSDSREESDEEEVLVPLDELVPQEEERDNLTLEKKIRCNYSTKIILDFQSNPPRFFRNNASVLSAASGISSASMTLMISTLKGIFDILYVQLDIQGLFDFGLNNLVDMKSTRVDV